ncbi:hypothetical protein ZIOFF_064966 [Zingiber officinale]|uniref:protein-serine/threonine phosphatase n=1 Tax=Zingiber officinale TaxID=94328 RepID=A0A8J5EZE4_ZINOF|nr:hypothetical protein ZIOFF_064966 [Zingiber officinale]
MLVTLMNLLSSCWLPSDRYGYLGSDAVGRQDGLLWYKDSGLHFNGEFSMAVVQANNLLEDQCQIESGPLSLLESGPYGTFVGVYDGHGGPETSRYINDHLFQHLKRFAAEHQSISVDVIRKAYQATEEGFTSLVAKQWSTKPQLAAVGSCCLVGIVTGGMLYTANLGDSRVVLGKLVKATGEVLAVQLSAEHNVGIDSVRQELQSMHPEDKQIVVLKHNVWRAKGLIQLFQSLKLSEDESDGSESGFHGQDNDVADDDVFSIKADINKGTIYVSRSIGDVYLKKAEFNREPLFAKFRLRETFKKPILSSEPYISVQPLQPQDVFLIFASDGLWEHLSNQEAADIVHNNPHSGSARRLIKAALQEAAKKREMRYSDLQKIDRGVRRHFHDDITVVVVFLDSNLVSRASSHRGPSLSIKGGGITVPASSAPLSRIQYPPKSQPVVASKEGQTLDSSRGFLRSSTVAPLVALANRNGGFSTRKAVDDSDPLYKGHDYKKLHAFSSRCELSLTHNNVGVAKNNSDTKLRIALVVCAIIFLLFVSLSGSVSIRYSRSPSPYRGRSKSRSPPRDLSRSRSRSPPLRNRARSPSGSRDRDEAVNTGNTLYITGLSSRVTDRDLEHHFSREGKAFVEPRTRASRGFAFVTMETAKDADRCIKYLNQSILEGRYITVEKAVEVSETDTMEVTAVMSMAVVTVDLLDTLLIEVGEITHLGDHLIMITGTEEDDQGHFLLMVVEAQREHPLGVVLMAILHVRFQAWT